MIVSWFTHTSNQGNMIKQFIKVDRNIIKFIFESRRIRKRVKKSAYYESN